MEPVACKGVGKGGVLGGGGESGGDAGGTSGGRSDEGQGGGLVGGPAGVDASPVVGTISAHHGMGSPPRTSRSQSLDGTSGCPVSSKRWNQLPHHPWLRLKPHPCAFASVTLAAWQLDVKTRQ